MKTNVISAFQGVGVPEAVKVLKKNGIPTTFINSTHFPKEDLEKEYAKKVKSVVESGEFGIVLVDSHKHIRDELYRIGVEHTLVYPDVSLWPEYHKRFYTSGCSDRLIKLVDKMWTPWIKTIEEDIAAGNLTAVKLNNEEDTLLSLLSTTNLIKF